MYIRELTEVNSPVMARGISKNPLSPNRIESSMAAKTCLYCGKALVFLRMGAGGDFCSREHHKQYRLRRGMDALAEADKVATLARRRETPKAVFAPPAGAPSEAGTILAEVAMAARAGLVPQVAPMRKTPVAPVLRKTGAIALQEPYAPPHAARAALEMKALSATARAALPMARLSWRPDGAAKAARGPCSVPAASAPGNALRVSASVGFRLRAPLAPKPRTAGVGRAGVAAISVRAERGPFVWNVPKVGSSAACRLAFLEAGTAGAPAKTVRMKMDGLERAGQEWKV